MALGDFHVMPVGDVVEHESGEDCFCGPTAEPAERDDGSFGWVHVHHSVDGREFDERGEPVPPESI